MSVPVGSLVAVSNTVDSGHWLGLVVNQEAGKKWVDRDPCLEYCVPDEYGPLLVRVLGLKLTEGLGLNKSGLPTNEPRGTETVRWAYIQTIPNPPFVVAGPDVDSISKFFRMCRICDSLGNKEEASFSYEGAILEEYLRDVKKTADETSHFYKQFFAMLADVLPR